MMTQLPDFTAIPFRDAVTARADNISGRSWVTPEGIPVKPIYVPEDLARM